MAGSGSRKSEKDLKNIDMLTVRNVTKQEVTNVIFPNGITVGMDDGRFRNGLRIHGDAQISGIVNARGLRVNGEELSLSGHPFLFLDVDSYAAAFDDTDDTSPTPNSIAITITQQNQATTLQSSDIEAFKTGGAALTPTSFVVTSTSTGNSTATATLNISSLPATDFPITIRVTNDGLTSTKIISKVVGGDDGDIGTPGTTPATLFLDLSSTVAEFDNSSDTSPTPASINITVTQSGQVTSTVVGDITVTDSGGNPITVNGFSPSGPTGNTVATANFAPPSNQSLYPITATVSNDGLTSTKTVASSVGGDDAPTQAFTGSVGFEINLVGSGDPAGYQTPLARSAVGPGLRGVLINNNLYSSASLFPGYKVPSSYFNATFTPTTLGGESIALQQAASSWNGALWVPENTITIKSVSAVISLTDAQNLYNIVEWDRDGDSVADTPGDIAQLELYHTKYSIFEAAFSSQTTLNPITSIKSFNQTSGSMGDDWNLTAASSRSPVTYVLGQSGLQKTVPAGYPITARLVAHLRGQDENGGAFSNSPVRLEGKVAINIVYTHQ